MENRTVLDISPAIAEFAFAHGARQDPISKQWYVGGEVPTELLDFVPQQVRQAEREIGPSCPQCGSNTVKKNRKTDGDAFWSCSRFPRCRGTLPWQYSGIEHVSDVAIRATQPESSSEGQSMPSRDPVDVSALKVHWKRIVEIASKKTGGPNTAERWLNTPKVGLGGKKPIDIIRTEEGCRQVEQLLIKTFP